MLWGNLDKSSQKLSSILSAAIMCQASADVASVRRLLFEGQTLALQQLSLLNRSLRPSASQRRRGTAEWRCSETIFPAFALRGCWSQAGSFLTSVAIRRRISRLHEVTRGKPAARQVELDHSKLVIRGHEEITQPAGSALQVQESLRRRPRVHFCASSVMASL